MFADYSFKNKMKIFLFFMSISPQYMPKASKTLYMSNIRVLHFYQYICGQFHKIIFQRYDIFTTYLKNFDMKTLYPVFVSQ